MQGNIDHVTPLTIDDVSRIHFRGGSHLGISRANPTQGPRSSSRTRSISLLRLNVDMLHHHRRRRHRVLGHEARARRPAGRIRVVHVPKTIDNDLDLPAARRHLRLPDRAPHRRRHRQEPDGRRARPPRAGTSSSPWAARPAISRSASARPPARRSRSSPRSSPSQQHPLKTIVDTLVGAIIKRLSYGRRDGVAVIAEGLVRASTPRISTSLEGVERDAHGHIRIAEVDFGEILKDAGARSASRSSGSRPPSSPRTSATSCAAPTRSRSTWSTRATSATAPPSTCSRAATR